MARLDEVIKKNAVEELVRDNRIDASKVSVEVNDGTVTLTGEVPTYLARSSAYQDVQAVLGVQEVRNQLLVRYPASFPVPRDVEIQERIKNRLADSPDMDLVDMEVEVKAGHVTLRGTVDAYWKKLHAETLASNEPGVVLIENHLAVVPTLDIVDRAIAEDVMDSLEAKAEVDAERINVTVTDGQVTLTGSVSTLSGRRAADEAAFYTAGVRNVVNSVEVTGLSVP